MLIHLTHDIRPLIKLSFNTLKLEPRYTLSVLAASWGRTATNNLLDPEFVVAPITLKT
jgi:hypothetical protein